jgi:hypothetical protein
MDICIYEIIIVTNDNVISKKFDWEDYDHSLEIFLKDTLKENGFEGFHKDIDLYDRTVEEHPELIKDVGEFAAIAVRGSIMVAVQLCENKQLPYVGADLSNLKDEGVYIKEFDRLWSITELDRNKTPWGYLLTVDQKEKLVNAFSQFVSEEGLSQVYKNNVELLQSSPDENFVIFPDKSVSTDVIDAFEDLSTYRCLIVL